MTTMGASLVEHNSLKALLKVSCEPVQKCIIQGGRIEEAGVSLHTGKSFENRRSLDWKVYDASDFLSHSYNKTKLRKR